MADDCNTTNLPDIAQSNSSAPFQSDHSPEILSSRDFSIDKTRLKSILSRQKTTDKAYTKSVSYSRKKRNQKKRG